MSLTPPVFVIIKSHLSGSPSLILCLAFLPALYMLSLKTPLSIASKGLPVNLFYESRYLCLGRPGCWQNSLRQPICFIGIMEGFFKLFLFCRFTAQIYPMSDAQRPPQKSHESCDSINSCPTDCMKSELRIEFLSEEAIIVYRFVDRTSCSLLRAHRALRAH